MITVNGIKNCDTCRKALKWLETNDIEYKFRDFRKDGLEQTQVIDWIKEIGIDRLLNRRGTTWRKLSVADQESLGTGNAVTLLTENPTLIKRPVFNFNDKCFVGFTSEIKDILKGDC